MPEPSTSTVSPVTAVTEIRVVVEPPSRFGDEWGFGSRLTIEQQADRAEQWAKEFHAFVRDHRHQDATSVHVERVKQTVCSGCGEPWETELDDEPEALHCTSCHKRVGGD